MKKQLQKKCIIMVGPQGSGKGTQAHLLAKKLGIIHISTGDIFREIGTKKTVLANKIKSLIDKGNLVPDNLVNEIVKERISERDCENGFILDGYPRDLAQSMFLAKIADVEKCILLVIPDKISIARISARRICTQCRENYNLVSQKPRRSEVCDKCGGRLGMRDDDKPEFVKKRLKKYHSQTAQMIEFYKKRQILITIDGNQSIEKVSGDIVHKIL